MENVVSIAPYADDAIHVSLLSVNSSAYRALNCLECGRKFLTRDNNTFWRQGMGLQQPRQAHVDESGGIRANCPDCAQKYIVTVSLTIERSVTILASINESIYFVAVPNKERRYTRCMECGKAFHIMNDRISQVVDNAMPLEFIDKSKLAPLEAMCGFSRCRQQWSFMVG